MLALASVLIRRLLPQLSTESPRQEGLRTWLEAGSFYVGIGTAADEVLFRNLRLTEIVPFIAFDFERFALSSVESALHHGTEIMGPKALGWPLVRLYYAAFFGAHAIMRATGRAVLRIENPQALRISQIGSFYLPSFKVSTGTYIWTLVENPDLTIDGQMHKLPDAGVPTISFGERSTSSSVPSVMRLCETKNPKRRSPQLRHRTYGISSVRTASVVVLGYRLFGTSSRTSISMAPVSCFRDPTPRLSNI